MLKDGKVFLQKRGKNTKYGAGQWELPGGGVEYGEALAAAAKREIGEETGVEVEVVEQLGTSDYIVPEENQHWITSLFLCKIISGTPSIMEPEKCEEQGWFTLAEAQKLDLAFITRRDIDNLKKKYPKILPENL